MPGRPFKDFKWGGNFSRTEFNRALAAVERLDKLSVAPPLELFHSAAGPTLRLAEYELWAEVRGGDFTGPGFFPYSWAEVETSGDGSWHVKEGGYSGDTTHNPAYEVNNNYVPPGTVVRLLPGVRGEYLFEHCCDGGDSGLGCGLTRDALGRLAVDTDALAGDGLIAGFVLAPLPPSADTTGYQCPWCLAGTAPAYWTADVSGFGGGCADKNGHFQFDCVSCCEWRGTNANGVSARVAIFGYGGGGAEYVLEFDDLSTYLYLQSPITPGTQVVDCTGFKILATQEQMVFCTAAVPETITITPHNPGGGCLCGAGTGSGGDDSPHICVLSVNPGCGLEIDPDTRAVQVNPEDLAGLGLVAAGGGSGSGLVTGCAIDVDTAVAETQTYEFVTHTEIYQDGCAVFQNVFKQTLAFDLNSIGLVVNVTGGPETSEVFAVDLCDCACGSGSGSGKPCTCLYRVTARLDWTGNGDLDVYLSNEAGVCYYGAPAAAGLALNHDAHPNCSPHPEQPETIVGVFSATHTFHGWYNQWSDCQPETTPSVKSLTVENIGGSVLTVNGTAIGAGSSLVFDLAYAGYATHNVSSYADGTQVAITCCHETHDVTTPCCLDVPIPNILYLSLSLPTNPSNLPAACICAAGATIQLTYDVGAVAWLGAGTVCGQPVTIKFDCYDPVGGSWECLITGPGGTESLGTSPPVPCDPFIWDEEACLNNLCVGCVHTTVTE